MEIAEQEVGNIVRVPPYEWDEEYIGGGFWEAKCKDLNLVVRSTSRKSLRSRARESTSSLFAYLIESKEFRGFFIKRNLVIPIVLIPNCPLDKMVYDVTCKF